MNASTKGTAAGKSAGSMRARRIGFVAGIVAITCCVYPIVLFLLGAATATEAIAVGNKLYGAWGWLFKLLGGLFAVAGIIIQLKRRGQCSPAGVKKAWPFIARVALVTVGVYGSIYILTKALAKGKS